MQRLGPPHWPKYPPGAAYGAALRADRDGGLAAARLGARLIAADLAGGRHRRRLPAARRRAGRGGRCGDRRSRLWRPARKVAALAGAFAEGLADGGVLPVLKHIPGHGRATADSHQRLPVVTTDRATLEATDFAAFRPLAGLPLAMTAHVVFTAFDPVAPATTSAAIVREVIRGSIGLSGTVNERRPLHGGAGRVRLASARCGARGGLRHGAALQRQDGRDARGCRSRPGARRRGGAAARRPRWRGVNRPAPIDLAASRAEFVQLMSAVWEPARGLV